jgi:hypothetical protein
MLLLQDGLQLLVHPVPMPVHPGCRCRLVQVQIVAGQCSKRSRVVAVWSRGRCGLAPMASAGLLEVEGLSCRGDLAVLCSGLPGHMVSPGQSFAVDFTWHLACAVSAFSLWCITVCAALWVHAGVDGGCTTEQAYLQQLLAVLHTGQLGSLHSGTGIMRQPMRHCTSTMYQLHAGMCMPGIAVKEVRHCDMSVWELPDLLQMLAGERYVSGSRRAEQCHLSCT